MTNATREVVLKADKATVYLKNEFFGNINKIEVRDLEIKKGSYAQYDVAYHFTFVPKGKRKRRGAVVYGEYAFVLVLDGQGNDLNPVDLLGTPQRDDSTGVTVKQSRYRSFDGRFVTEFAAAYLGYKVNTGTEALFSVGLDKAIETLKAA